MSVGFGSLTATNVDISADAEGGDGFNGGIATGGELASMTNRSGGSIAIDSVLIAANGIGGNSFGGVAGAGQGGEALLAFDGGDTLVNTNARSRPMAAAVQAMRVMVQLAQAVSPLSPIITVLLQARLRSMATQLFSPMALAVMGPAVSPAAPGLVEMARSGHRLGLW